MTDIQPETEGAQWVSARQGRFIRYLLYVLVDLTVLNLFVEYWDRMVIDSFTISLLTAVLLQVLLKATLAIEHRIAGYFQARSGPGALVVRVLATWALLFGSKFVILEAVDIVFWRSRRLWWPDPFHHPRRRAARSREDPHPHLRQPRLNDAVRTGWPQFLSLVHVKGTEGKGALDSWLSWARRYRLPAFVELAKKAHQTPSSHRRQPRTRPVPRTHRIIQHQDPATHRIAFGFHGPRPLIALALLALAATTTTPWPNLTHGSNRRTTYGLGVPSCPGLPDYDV